MSADVGHATPADAALLRLLADIQERSAQIADEVIEPTSALFLDRAARLRALADQMERDRKEVGAAMIDAALAVMEREYAGRVLFSRFSIHAALTAALSVPHPSPPDSPGDRPGGGGVGEQR